MTRSRIIPPGPTRRRVLAGLAATGAGLALTRASALAQGPASAGALHMREIPIDAAPIPAIGMGSWITFNVGSDRNAREQRTQVLRTFFARGGRLIDSSPMYGTSEAVIGHCLEQIGNDARPFAATKVWTMTQYLGRRQMDNSRALWGRDIDLMQVHNLLDWDSHIETLKADKQAGRIRYIGVTTSHGRRHDELEQVMKTQPLDFVQFTYNILDREAEARLLPLAAERGIAVICNRPFRRRGLIRLVEPHPLPAWAREIDCANWPQVLLKFIISHPAVTCAIPATSRVDHMDENMGALTGPLPDDALRARMAAHVEAL